MAQLLWLPSFPSCGKPILWIKKIVVHAFWVLIFTQSSPAHAQLGEFIGKVVNTGAKVVTAPVQTIINTAKVVTGSKPPSAILDPVKDVGRTTGQAVSAGTNLAVQPTEFFYREAQKIAAQAGAPGEFIFDVATVGPRIQAEFAKSSGQVAANLLELENPFQVVGIPLATAIREGRERFDSKASPLPDDVKAGLAGLYISGVLDRARYAVGTIEITLPNGIGQVKKFGDSGYAVVVDDIIVFNRKPPSFADDPWWWGHEVTHVEQYQQIGVEEFALRYVRSGGAELENPANSRGNEAKRVATQRGVVTSGVNATPIRQDIESQPLYRKGYDPNVTPNQLRMALPPPPPPDPAVVQCVFPQDFRPVSYLVTQGGRIIVVDRMTGQWMHIGWAVPAQIPRVAWHYSVAGIFYDVLPNGAIFERTIFGNRQVGFVYRLQS